ncbi:MAG: hypothetical protein PHQ12_02965 [Chthoniobacteraceae bacterium]|nr:hypothetical protein [Chthoniobacteraceae bacterium]
MKKHSLHGALGAICLLAFGGSACADDAPPVDLKGLIQTLKEIKTKRSTSEKSFEMKLEQDFRASSSSNSAAISFYDRAAQAVQGDKVRPDLAEWEKSEAAQNAARLHVSYLLLTLQRAQGATTKQLEPAIMAHINALTAAGSKDETIQHRRDREQELKEAGFRQPNIKGKPGPAHEPLFWDQELIKQSVKNSVFVQWYGISKMLDGAKEWEFAPGNVDGMYQNTLLPYYRQNKDPRIIAYWDNKMQQEMQDASQNGTFKADQFNNVRRPQLVWKRALDMIAIGLRNRGMGDMVTLVKSYPDHPDLPDWISQLETMVADAAPAPKPAAPADASAPAESPAAPAPAPQGN